MNGVDYTKQLAKERDNFQDTIQRNKVATEKRINDTEKLAERKIDHTRETAIKDRADLETGYQKSLNHLKDRTEASIDDNRSKSNNDLAREREQFTKESVIKSKDFDQRLNDIKSSYKKAFDSEKDNHEELQKTQKNRYQRNISEVVDKTDKSLAKYQEKMHGAGADLKDQHNRERQQLVRSQEENLLEVYKDNAAKRAAQREQINTDITKTRLVHEADLDNQKQYTIDRLGNMQKQYQDRVKGMATDYSSRSDKLASITQEQQIKANKEHQNAIDSERRGFNKQMRLVELDKRRRDNGSGEFSNVVQKQQGLKNEQVMDARLRGMRNEVIDQKDRYQEMAQNNQDDFNESLRKENAEATANLDRKLFAANADKLITVAHEREKAHSSVSNRERQNKIDKDTFERQLQVDRHNANNRLTKLKQDFNTSMQTLEEKHRNDITEVTTTANIDKKQFQKDLHERRNSELFDMKREFTKLLDTTVLEYENKLADYQRQNDVLSATMDTKVQNIVDQMDKSLDTERKLNADKRQADLRSHQLLMDQRENQLRTQMNEISGGYQRKMTLMQNENDRKMKLLTNDYESKLKLLGSQKDKEMNDKDLNHAQEQERLKIAYAEEKNRLVDQYKNQIESAKKTHSEQMEQMKNFKSLT